MFQRSGPNTEIRKLTSCVLVDFNRSVVHLGYSLHFNVVAVTLLHTLAIDVVVKIFVGNILREVVCVLQL